MSVLSNRPFRVSMLATVAAATAATAVLAVLVAPAGLARPAPTPATAAAPAGGLLADQTKVVNLRVGAHRNFDRVVIDLVGRIPRYYVQYVRHLRYDGTGDPVPLKGRKFVSISLTPARAHGRLVSDHVYTGPRLRQYTSFDTLRGAALTGDFEGSVVFGLSLRHRAHLHVTVLHAPNRLVVDLHH